MFQILWVSDTHGTRANKSPESTGLAITISGSIPILPQQLGGWVRKSPKMWRHNIGMVPYPAE